MKQLFKRWLSWIGFYEELGPNQEKESTWKPPTSFAEIIQIKKPKPRKHYSRPTKIQKPKKGKGSYQRKKKINKDE